MPTMRVNDAEIYFERSGEGNEAVLFLSGTAGTSNLWRKVHAPFFARRFQTVTMDYRGTGRSELHPGRYSLPLFASDALAVLSGLGIARAHLVGHSMGSAVAIAAAAAAPERVQTLTLCSPGGHLNPEHVTTWGIPISLVLQLVEKGYEKRMQDHYTGAFWFPAEFRRQHPEAVAELAATLIGGLPPLEYYLKHVQARQEFRILDHVPRVQAPTLLVVGELDTILDGAMPSMEAAQRLHRLLPDAGLHVVPAAAHGYLWQDPEGVCQTIAAFIDGSPRP